MNAIPVLERVRVENYAMYAGTADKPALDHTFVPGVNVIVGINGLGKTTLLNMLLRGLTGAADVPGDDDLGEKKRRLVGADRYWFRQRVPDDAVNAHVTLWFHLGEHYFEVSRSLSNLDITALAVDQQPVGDMRPAEFEATYREHVIRAAGLASFEDFVFLLRYVVFYLEDRRSLVWDAAAQGEILSILFGEQGADRRQYVEVFNAILSKDSEYRNMRAVLNKRRKQADAQSKHLDEGQVEMLEKSLEAKRQELADLVETKKRAAHERDSLRTQIENRRSEVHDKRAALAYQLNTFYESFFPSVDDGGRYLLAQFEAGAGCLVCGSRSPVGIEHVRRELYMNTCPVCSGPLERGERHEHDPHAGERIAALRVEIERTEQDLNAMLEPLQLAEQTYATATATLVAVAADVASLEQQLEAFGQTLAGAMERREKLKGQLSTFEAALSLVEVEWRELTQQFRVLAEGIDEQVRVVSSRIEEAFACYIQGFLAEQCQIRYSVRQSSLGQLTAVDAFPFPYFVPALTSGVHRDSVTVRVLGQSVSESQKEFIDLAFRMALLEVAAPDAPSMIVLETPEASLDSVFVPRAGDLLRRFAARPGGPAGTRLIASSNVNRELMIPALFGSYPDANFYGQVTDEQPHEVPDPVPEQERAAHVLDLLSIAAPTRALERFRSAYEHERDRAIYPERYVQQGSA